MTADAREVSESVRAACAWVAERSRSVAIDEERLAGLAAELATAGSSSADDGEAFRSDPEDRAAFVLCLDAINFGSGWWPTIRKRPGLSGYGTVAAALEERFRGAGPWTAGELSRLRPAEVAAVLGQDPAHPLMTDYATALADVGDRIEGEHEGSFAAVFDDAAGSAPRLAGILAGWAAFADTSSYAGRPVPFFKRAQIAAADAVRMGAADLDGVERLTAFADNLVPHVLRVDGILRLDSSLEARIEAEELLEHGSPEEVELRACAVQAIEQLAASTPLCPAEIDALLWNRGRSQRYKSRPRPRCRNTAY
jgi:hypothetical protein